MKNRRRFLSVVMAFAIILSMSIPAMAVTEEIPEGYRLQRGLIVNNSISYEAIESMDSVMVRELIGGGPIEAYVVESFYIDENADGIQLADTSASFSIGYSVQRSTKKAVDTTILKLWQDAII